MACERLKQMFDLITAALSIESTSPETVAFKLTLKARLNAAWIFNIARSYCSLHLLMHLSSLLPWKWSIWTAVDIF